VRKVYHSDILFGVVVGVIAVGVFALYAIVVWDSATSSSFQSQMLPLVGMLIAMSVVRGPIDRLGPGPRFLCWFIFFTVSFALFAVTRREGFNLALAAGMGLALATFGLVADYFRSRREAHR
jgi:hypothetical protein